ncbi:MAG: GIY-YIG nuclease family protein [Rickettsiales bacterium]|nr:MAG: GIY-YIG nuclease family protein [Rickettsiales bacterium]
MNKSIYIISTKEKADNNIYKIGVHVGDINKLICRYATYLLHPVVNYFCYIDSNLDIESALKDEFINERLINCNNRRSEWVELPLKQISKCLNSLINGAFHNLVIDLSRDINHFTKKNKIALAKSDYPKLVDCDNGDRFNMLIDHIAQGVICSEVDLKRLKVVENLLDIAKDVTGFDIVDNNDDAQENGEVLLFSNKKE